MKQGLKKYFFVLAFMALDPTLAFADAADQWVQYAAKQYAAKQYDQAISSYNNALKINARSDKAYQGLGNCYLGKGDQAKALTYYKYALQINPGNSSLAQYVAQLGGAGAATAAPGQPAAGNTELEKYYKYGNQYLTAKNYDYAIAYFNKALQIDPNSAKVNQAMGTAYVYKGQKDQALAYFDKAVAADPGNASLKGYVDQLRGSSAGANTQANAGAASSEPKNSMIPYVMGGILFAAATAMIFLF